MFSQETAATRAVRTVSPCEQERRGRRKKGEWKGEYDMKIFLSLWSGERVGQGVTKRCRLSWLTNSALVYESQCGGMEVGCGISASEYNSAHHVTWSPNNLWRSTSIFNLWGGRSSVLRVVTVNVN